MSEEENTSRRFSLVIGTLDRTADLENLFSSLTYQQFWDYEIILVDQNSDDRLVGIVTRWREKMSSLSSGEFNQKQLIHLRCHPGLSRARNHGLAVASGQIIAFPDDDCWYPPDILRLVSNWFKDNATYDVLSLAAKDENGVRSGNRWHAQSCDLASWNVFRASASYTLFFRQTGHADLRFDEELGIGSGTPFGSAEDTDLVLNVLSRSRGRFESKWYIGHPQKDMMGSRMTRDRSHSYGLGMGRVLAKHSLFLIWVAFVSFDIVRSIALAVTGKRVPAALYLAHGKGILSSYFSSRLGS